MKTVLAALDTSPSAAAVLDTALRLGELTGATIEAVHVRDGPTSRRSGSLRRPESPARARRSRPEEPPRRRRRSRCRCRRARSTGDFERSPQSNRRHRTPRARADRQASRRRTTGHGPKRRAVPSPAGAAGGRSVISPDRRHPVSLIVADVELVVLHVFTAATIPPVMDRPSRDLAMWGSEFLARHCPNVTHRAAHRVNRVASERRMPGRTRRSHRAELVATQLAQSG